VSGPHLVSVIRANGGGSSRAREPNAKLTIMSASEFEPVPRACRNNGTKISR
jgi:hypothetical protein